MKLVRTDTLDSISDYRLLDEPAPSPGSGEALIGVRACGVGYVDALVALGRYQVKPSLPHIPGQEVAGRIVALGAGVAGLSIGDRVMATVRGGFAEFATAPLSQIVRIPDGMAFGQAAGFRVNYLTAIHGLADRAALRPGQHLLVLGAAGGVGTAAVQVGKVLGAKVIAAASTAEKRQFALAQGADAVIDTAAEGWRDRLKAAGDGRGPDVVFDPVCGPLLEPAFRSLAWGGRHLVVGFAGGPIPSLPVNLSLMKGAALVGVDVRQFMLFEEARAASHLSQLLAWVAEGRLAPPIGRRYALAEFAAALEFGLSGHGLGKTIVDVVPADQQ